MLIGSKIFMRISWFLLYGSLMLGSDKAFHTYFIQAPLPMVIIRNLQETMSPIINRIIQEESGIKPDPSVPVFFFKKRAAITIYYINDMYVDGEPFVLSAFDTMQNLPAPEMVEISPSADFLVSQRMSSYVLIRRLKKQFAKPMNATLLSITEPCMIISKVKSILTMIKRESPRY